MLRLPIEAAGVPVGVEVSGPANWKDEGRGVSNKNRGRLIACLSRQAGRYDLPVHAAGVPDGGWGVCAGQLEGGKSP